jgi:hypothetical protein
MSERNGEPAARQHRLVVVVEVILLVALFFAAVGVAPPSFNEAHYFAKSKNYWDPSWCSNDLFASSGNPHWLFHVTFGAFSQWCTLEATAWIGRVIGWTMIAIGLNSLTRAFSDRAFASLGVAILWIGGVESFDLAGEWIVGGIEGKVPAYGLLLIAMRLMIDGRWSYVWPLLGIASAFHVLVGGWSVLIALPLYWFYGRDAAPLKSQLLPLFVGGGFAMIGVYPALALTRGVDPATVTAAAKIYSYERLTHHLLPSAFGLKHYIRHALLIVATLIALRKLHDQKRYRMLRFFTLGMVAIAAVGMLVGALQNVAPDVAAKLLKYYWFRMTDAVVPLAFALAWLQLPEVAKDSLRIRRVRWVVTAIALWAVFDAGMESSRMTVRTDSGRIASAIGMNTNSANRKRVVSDWIAVCEWVDRTLPKEEILLTPRNQQSFKWYANRAEVVNWKDVPQDADRLVEWSRRFFDVFPLRLGTVRVTVKYADLIRFRKEYGARFIIVDRRYSGESLPLVQIYPVAPYESNETYGVYRLP